MSDSDTKGRDRPTLEIEITQEMLDAGSEALNPFYLGDGVYDVTDPAIEAIYRAMFQLRPKRG